MVLKGVSIFLLVSAGLSAVSFLSHMIGFGAPFWISNDSYHSGLWRICYRNNKCFDLVGIETTGLLEAIQTLETLSFFILLATVVVFCLRFTLMKDNVFLPRLTIGSQFGTVVLSLFGVIIFAAKEHHEHKQTDFGYAFGLVIAASIISFVAGVLNYLEYRISKSGTPT